jgi:hypothetical protein
MGWPTGEFALGARVVLAFWGHCLRRALHIERTMRQFVGFDEMLLCMAPVAVQRPILLGRTTERWVTRAAGWCAYAFPGVWRRRCLFRSLLVLDWARGLGIDTTLNVGMELGVARDQGHCWLSIGDKAFCEPFGWPGRYGELFHRCGNLQYWTSLAPDARAGEELHERDGAGARESCGCSG